MSSFAKITSCKLLSAYPDVRVIYSGAHWKFYEKYYGCFLEYSKSHKAYENNQYSIENHYQNATKNEKKMFKLLKFRGFLRAFLKFHVFFENY